MVFCRATGSSGKTVNAIQTECLYLFPKNILSFFGTKNEWTKCNVNNRYEIRLWYKSRHTPTPRWDDSRRDACHAAFSFGYRNWGKIDYTGGVRLSSFLLIPSTRIVLHEFLLVFALLCSHSYFWLWLQFWKESRCSFVCFDRILSIFLRFSHSCFWDHDFCVHLSDFREQQLKTLSLTLSMKIEIITAFMLLTKMLFLFKMSKSSVNRMSFSFFLCLIFD